MGWLLVGRLRSFALVAFGASFVLNLVLAFAAISVLQLLHHVPILCGVVLFAVFLVYAADRLRADALASASRTFDRDLVPAAIANSLEALRDIKLLRSSLGNPGVLALLDGPSWPLYLLAIAWIHPLLGLGALVGVALLIFGLAMTAELRKCAESDSLLHAARAAHDQAEGLVRSAETLIAMGMSQSAIAVWRARHEHLLSSRQDGDHGAARLGAVARAGSLALQVGMLALGAWLVAQSRLGIAGMIAAALLLGKALQPVEQLIGNLPVLIAAHGAWLRLNRRGTSIVVAGLDTPVAAGRVELERVCYAPSAGRPASIRNITLNLAPGESILIVGPSGCGKTTLARLLLGVLRPHSGTVRIDSTDLARWDRAAFGQCVGYVSQDVHLFPGTIADNIARLGVLDSTRVVQAARLAHAHEMIVRTPEGYHTEVGEGGARLAASQRRRIALARALYVNPRLLVLDEPSADLDADGELALVRTLAELKERGVTVVIVEQRTRFLEHVDGMAFLRDGTLQLVERKELEPYSTAEVVLCIAPSCNRCKMAASRAAVAAVEVVVVDSVLAELLASWTSQSSARNGSRLCVRPLRPDDREREIEFINSLSERSRYFRLMTPLKFLPPHLLDRLMDIDYDRRMAFVATIEEEGREQFVGIARYGETDRPDTVELGITVTDRWQRQGIARVLFAELLRFARWRGIRRMEGIVLHDNLPMIELAKSIGFHAAHDYAQHVVVISQSLDSGQ